VACGRPWQGYIFLQMRSAKLAYKRAINPFSALHDVYIRHVYRCPHVPCLT